MVFIPNQLGKHTTEGWNKLLTLFFFSADLTTGDLLFEFQVVIGTSLRIWGGLPWFPWNHYDTQGGENVGRNEYVEKGPMSDQDR